MTKAYWVQDEWSDNGGTIVFAEKNVVARREGSQELDVEFGKVSCKRASQWDKYAGQGVPISVMLADGYAQYCAACESLVHDDQEDKVVDDDMDLAYCNEICRNKFRLMWGK